MQASMIPTATSDDDGLIYMITRRTDDIHPLIHLSSINEMIMSPDLHLRLARMHRGGAAGEAATTVGLLAPLPLMVWNGCKILNCISLVPARSKYTTDADTTA
jgi:hypothetical protein